MSPTAPTLDKTYHRYADLLLEHHRLLSEGREDAPETEAVEEEMTRLWERLDPPQRSSLSGLGSDLNWVRRRASDAPRGHKAAAVTQQDSQDLANALKSLDWHAVLHQLRICVSQIPVLEQATIRSNAWTQLGLPKVAAIFAEFARELQKELVP